MKNIIIWISLFLTCLTTEAQNGHSSSFKTLDGQAVSFSTYAGKKLMVIILPLSQSDSLFAPLRSFLLRYQDSLQVIGIPSLDDGFDTKDAASLLLLYAGLRLVITEGMHTHKASGGKQAVLFKWMTDKKQNLSFDDEVIGVGHKFFINEAGRLYGSMPPQISLSDPIIKAIIHSSAN